MEVGMCSLRPMAMLVLGLVASTACSTTTVRTDVTSLEGTTWRLSALADHAPVAGSSITMHFAADDRVEGSGGCNRYASSYALDGVHLRFGPAAATRMACADDAVMDQEHAFFRALEAVATVRREGDRLELRGEDGVVALTLVGTTER